MTDRELLLELQKIKELCAEHAMKIEHIYPGLADKLDAAWNDASDEIGRLQLQHPDTRDRGGLPIPPRVTVGCRLREESMRDDPLYLCGHYEARLDALRAVIRQAGPYMGSGDRRLMMDILGMTDLPEAIVPVPSHEPPMPAPSPLCNDEPVF